MSALCILLAMVIVFLVFLIVMKGLYPPMEMLPMDSEHYAANTSKVDFDGVGANGSTTQNY